MLFSSFSDVVAKNRMDSSLMTTGLLPRSSAGTTSLGWVSGILIASGGAKAGRIKEAS